MRQPVLHMTDLYHPRNDPDDHWDVAISYGLHYKGHIDLKGICFDGIHSDYGNPSIDAVSQMNYITNEAVPMGIGSNIKLSDENVFNEVLKMEPNGAVRLILKTLETSKEPVVIHVCGSCRDIAIAGALRPDLFEKNCKGIYLNAGSTDPMTRLEWNVWLDPYAYVKVFDIPCNIYWLPCMHTFPEFVEVYDCAFFNMPQIDVLPYLSDRVKKYFLYMFENVSDTQYIDYLLKPLDEERLMHYAKEIRQMYCPAAYFHGAGYSVDKLGDLISKDDINSVFRFVPVKLELEKDTAMLKSIEYCEKSNIYLLNHSDEFYASALCSAIKNLLVELP